MREFLAFKVQDRLNEVSILLLTGKLFQQFLMDAYTMIESQRLLFSNTYQKQLRAYLYKSLQEAVLRE